MVVQGSGTEYPPWVEIALRERGTRELPGERSNPRIIEYFSYTRLGGTTITDSTAWCSAFVNFCVEKAGDRPTHRANARSWEDWGEKLREPRVGAIAVLWRGTPESHAGHVGFLIQELPNTVVLLGGNQDNMVGYKEYGKGRVLSYRWPRELDRLVPQAR